MPKKAHTKYDSVKIIIEESDDESRSAAGYLLKRYKLRSWSTIKQGKAEISSPTERKDTFGFAWGAVSAAMRWARHLVRTDRADHVDVVFRPKDTKKDLYFAYVLPSADAPELEMARERTKPKDDKATTAGS